MAMITLYSFLGVIVKHHSRQGDVHQGSASLRKHFQGMTSEYAPNTLYMGPRLQERVITTEKI
ncbi:hypothetical protein I79_001658 [Cricetulus griseus]|uniref:Uncharacterized protein n=1 Tax=Cricetulus griseus TaxID=10029 RepID=G3GVC3_CRIGR|nr:hypothetical protein I79_001658 [Cricetulus griseus]